MGGVSSTALPKEPPAIPRVSSTALPMEPPAIAPGGEEDLISALPDELLHIILVRLQCAAAAARTSVLSRRWRGVWAHMPELVLGDIPAAATTASALLDSIDAALNSYAAPTLRSLDIDVRGLVQCDVPAPPPRAATTVHSLLDSIDAALNSYAAPTLRNLDIDVIEFDKCDVPANRISPWLRFASERLAGKLRLRLALNRHNKEELVLPICERATEIDIDIYLISKVFLRPPPTGSFSVLTNLKIAVGQMDGDELGRMVSSVQCPCLRKLHVSVWELEPARNISISSESLECLGYNARGTGKLEVHAPMLKGIEMRSAPAEACIAAPKLEDVNWDATYDPCRHQFAVAGCHIRSLSIKVSTLFCLISSTQLMERFDTVSELTVYLSLGKGVAAYTTFLKEMDKLPICETLVVHLMISNRCGHDFAPIMLHLLRRSMCIRKFKIVLDQYTPSEMPSCTASNCPCLLPENYRLDDITFDSLEEIGIGSFTGSAEQEEFLKLLLSRCNTVTTLKRVDFTVPFVRVSSEIMEVVQRISSMCLPNSKVQFDVQPKP